MRTKALLGLAALVAGAFSAAAQGNVYSLNIVGYVNVATPKAYTFQSSPLKAATEGALDVLPNVGGARDGSQILIWQGTKWSTYIYNSTQDPLTTGFEDIIGNPIPAPVLSSGLGFLYNNLSGADAVNTYVGEVRTSPATLPLRISPIQAVGSTLPFGGTTTAAGGISTALGLVNTGGALDGCEVQQLVRTPTGAVKGFSVTAFNSTQDPFTTGFENRAGDPMPEPVIGMGEGFFFNNLSGSAKTWTQTLP